MVVVRVTVGVVARLRVRWVVLRREATEPPGRGHADPTSIAVDSRDFRDRIRDRRPGPIHHTPGKIYSEADSNQECEPLAGPPIVIAAVVVLAGCNAFAGGDTETDTPTVTPVDVPTDEPTATPVPMLAPVLTGASVVDTGDLADAHDVNLVDGSFTNVANDTVRYANGTLHFQSNRTAQVANATGPFYRVAQFEESLPYADYPDRLRTWS